MQGEVVAERYRLVSLVGRGSTGVVWQAVDDRLGRVVAVKLLDASADSPDAVRRMVHEGRVAAKLRHPHAISVHDVVEHAGKPCLVLEYLPSRSLMELVAERGPLPPDVVAAVGRQVAAALAAAHGEGIVHRDVTPFNVLLTEDGTAKITDFGIARAVGEGTVTDARLIVGTPAFLAPEVAEGRVASFASDVFSLGATLYTALEGNPPFGNAENPYALLRRVAAGELTPPRSSGPLVEVLLRLLRRDEAERPTMAEAHRALTAVVDGRPLPPPPARHGTLLLPTPRRWRRVAVVAGAVALVAGGVAIGSLLGNDEPAGAQPTTTTTAPPAGCEAAFAVTNSWPGGYQVEVTVRNAGREDVNGWTVSWSRPSGHTIGNLWNGSLTQDGTSVTVKNAGYNAVLPAAGTTSFGFVATGSEPTPPEVACTSGH